MEIRHLDFYCERTSADFWAEPWNAWSNIFFFAAGLWALWTWFSWRKQAPQSVKYRTLVLAGLLLLVGVGSFLFHTYANNYTHLGDLIPIFIFTSAYLYHSARHYMDFSSKISWILLIGCVGSMFLIQKNVPTSVLNGSLLYAPPLLLMFYFAKGMRRSTYSKWAGMYGFASWVFLFSLIFRTMDSAICESWPIGTHFIWHTLNGICLGTLLILALKVDREKSMASRN